MTDKQQVENIVRLIARSFSGADSTKDWTSKTIERTYKADGQTITI